MLKKILLGSVIALSLSSPALAEKSVIILPFEVSTKNPEIKAFGVGIMDILAQSLSMTDSFSVIDRGAMQSQLREKNILKTINLNKIADVKKVFNTDLIINGKIQDFKNKYVISFSTVDTKTNKSVATSQLIGNDIFDLQNKIAIEIISQQKLSLTEDQKKRVNLISKSTNNINAYSNYIKGKSYFYLSTPESYKEAIKYFNKSLSFDKNYIMSSVEKAETLSLLAFYSKLEGTEDINLIQEAEDTLNSTDKSAENTIAFHKSKSFIHYLKGESKNSEDEAKKAIELNPNDPEANYLYWINQEKEDIPLNPDDEQLNQIIKSSPYFPLTYIHKAILLAKLNKSADAVSNYETVTNFIPENSFIYNKLGELYLADNKYNEAKDNYENALKINPNNLQSNLGIAQIYQAQDEPEKAINYYNKALKINSNSSYPHFLLAISYHSIGKVSKAIEEYQSAIKLSPNDARYHSGLGQLYYQQNKTDDAVNEYKKALEINKDLAYAHVNLGLAYNKQGKTDEAIEEIKEALKIKNDYVYAYYNLGLVYQDQGKKDAAMNAFKDALNRDPDYAMAHNKLGVIYQEQGYIEEAVEEITKAIKLEPTYSNAYYNLGKVHRAQNKYTEAIQAYKLSLKLKPQNKQTIEELSATYSSMAVDLYNKNKIKEAITAYKEAIKLKPNDESTYNNLGTAYFKSGKIKEAITEFKKAIMINPKNADSHDNLGLSYDKSGKKAEAKKEYQKACQLGKSVSCDYAK